MGFSATSYWRVELGVDIVVDERRIDRKMETRKQRSFSQTATPKVVASQSTFGCRENDVLHKLIVHVNNGRKGVKDPSRGELLSHSQDNFLPLSRDSFGYSRKGHKKTD